MSGANKVISVLSRYTPFDEPITEPVRTPRLASLLTIVLASLVLLYSSVAFLAWLVEEPVTVYSRFPMNNNFTPLRIRVAVECDVPSKCSFCGGTWGSGDIIDLEKSSLIEVGPDVFVGPKADCVDPMAMWMKESTDMSRVGNNPVFIKQIYTAMLMDGTKAVPPPVPGCSDKVVGYYDYPGSKAESDDGGANIVRRHADGSIATNGTTPIATADHPSLEQLKSAAKNSWVYSQMGTPFHIRKQKSQPVELCHASADPWDMNGVKVWVGNMKPGSQVILELFEDSQTVVKNKKSNNSLGKYISIKLQAGQEKSVTLGADVFRKKKPVNFFPSLDTASESSSETSEHSAEEFQTIDLQLKLESLSNDGKMVWKSGSAYGALVHIRLAKSADVYTIESKRNVWDIFGSIGGAYGLLVAVFTLILKCFMNTEEKIKRSTTRKGGDSGSNSNSQNDSNDNGSEEMKEEKTTSKKRNLPKDAVVGPKHKLGQDGGGQECYQSTVDPTKSV